MNNPAKVTGDQLGLAFPVTLEGLVQSGPDFLTAAFRASGVLAADNHVTQVTGWSEFHGGGMGRKLLLSVTYAQPKDRLSNDLFVKFTLDAGHPMRDLFAPLMQPEVRFALLSRQAGFPITVPRCYFGDYHEVTSSGILITERIAYGEGRIEPRHDKCLDHELADPLGHYRAMTVAIARLAGYHKSGRFGPGTDVEFPFVPDKIDAGSRIPYTPQQLQAKLEKLKSFAQAAPQLFEPQLVDAGFLDRFAADAALVLEHEVAIRRHLNEQAAYVALCHWNVNLDNAWFWPDESGVLQAGLLDWGSVGQMNLAQAFYGMVCAAETDFLEQHRYDLMGLFLAEYERNGGPRLDPLAFARMVDLSIALLGIAWILDAPSLVESTIQDAGRLSGRHDPVLRENFFARAQLQLLMVFLNEWRVNAIGDAIREFAARGGLKFTPASVHAGPDAVQRVDLASLSSEN